MIATSWFLTLPCAATNGSQAVSGARPHAAGAENAQRSGLRERERLAEVAHLLLDGRHDVVHDGEAGLAHQHLVDLDRSARVVADDGRVCRESEAERARISAGAGAYQRRWIVAGALAE